MMKKIIKITILLTAVCWLSACEDMLNTGSNRVLYTEDNTLDSQNNSPYSLMGILSRFSHLGDRYVILGELRGELMDITPNADINLQQINNHEITAQNPYATDREYYAVINNCNYFLQRADTSLMSEGDRPLLQEYAVIKAIRAWTYFQLGLNYGKAVYLEEPVLTLDDMQKNHPVYDLNQLVDVLINGLVPYADLEVSWPQNYVSLHFLLGDLYLWKGEYEKAAEAYYELMYRNLHTVTSTKSGWTSETFQYYDNSWLSVFFGDYESISSIYYNVGVLDLSLPYLFAPVESNFNFEYKLTVAQAAKDLWNSEIYTFYNPTTRMVSNTTGDMRGLYSSYNFSTLNQDSIPYISKYIYSNGGILIGGRAFLYRISTLYLRYAEAVNRLGKPSLAFAVMKYGLNRANMQYVKPGELTDMPYYCNFNDNRFNGNVATRAHGLGSTDRDTVYYVFPKLATLQDSIVYAEDLICKELALETAFEGNRFHDLMRFATRRNDPDFLASRVARKNPALRSKLQNSANWFLPRE